MYLEIGRNLGDACEWIVVEVALLHLAIPDRDFQAECRTQAVDRAAFGKTQIGTGSKIDNLVQVGHNARIGRNCLIGANALITEGKEIPDNSMVMGAPGKVVKTLSDEQVAGLKMSAEGYWKNAQRFMRGLSVQDAADLIR